MRQPNHNFPTQNKACVCITSQLYDRRALDGPLPTLPLISSLTHLSYLTSTSPRIREILTLDGGLERLVAIVAGSLDAACRASKQQALDLNAPSQGGPFRSFASYSKKTNSEHSSQNANALAAPKGSVTYSRSLLITYTLSIQALCNVGVRGTEPVRTRVVEAGVLKVAAQILKSFLDERDRKAGELANKVKQQYKALRASTWEGGNTATFSVSPMQDLPTQALLLGEGPSLSVPSSQFPSRSGSPGALLQPSASGSRLSGLFNAVDDAAGSSDGDHEREEDEPEEASQAEQLAAALEARGRARSLTLKNDSIGPSDSAAPVDDVEMASDLQGQPQAMDIDDDLETVIGSRAAMDSARVSPRREDNLLLSPHGSYPIPLSFTTHQSTTPSVNLTSPIASMSSPTPSTSQLPDDGFRFREEEVLTCLHLLAYLSKYPHVRAVFHDPDSDFACSTFSSAIDPPAAPADKSTNIFSLVEKFTVRPAPGDRITPRLPTEIQYWAGVIMRNACRKDEARGGIRQCANMLCGEWEHFPREFAKCRRCRKAKYCSKSCQSRAWQGGHRYWCSAKDGAEAREASGQSSSRHANERRNDDAATRTPTAARRRPRAMTDPVRAATESIRALVDDDENTPTIRRFTEEEEERVHEALVDLDGQDSQIEIAGLMMNSEMLLTGAAEILM